MREEGGRRGESMGQAEKYLHVWMNAGLCVISVLYVVLYCTLYVCAQWCACLFQAVWVHLITDQPLMLILSSGTRRVT